MWKACSVLVALPMHPDLTSCWFLLAGVRCVVQQPQANAWLNEHLFWLTVLTKG